MKPVIVALLCVAAAFGQTKQEREDGLEKGTYAPDIEAKEWINTKNGEPLSLTELRGMVVVLFFWVTWHPGGEMVMPVMNEVNSEVGHAQGVFLIGLTDANRKRVEDMLKKEKAFFAIGTESKAYEEYKIKAFPRAVVIDASGKVYWTGWPGQTSELSKAILDSIAENPPSKTHPEEARLAEGKLRAARHALREDSFRDAFKAAREADNHALTGDPLKTRCQELLDLIEALGRDQLVRAEQAAEDKDWETAVSLYRDVRRDYLGLAVATRAKRRLDALKKKSPDVARILDRGNEAAEAENELGKALDLVRARRFGEAYVQLEDIVSKYEGTEAATKAQTVLDRMKSNNGIMGYVRDHKASKECMSLLSQARSFVGARRVDKAKEIYRRVIDEYPDTTYAEAAVKRLIQLP